jgi:hypothetical protein
MGSTSDSTEDLLNYIDTLTTNNKEDGFRLRNVSRDEVYHVIKNLYGQIVLQDQIKSPPNILNWLPTS